MRRCANMRDAWSYQRVARHKRQRVLSRSSGQDDGHCEERTPRLAACGIAVSGNGSC
jgi:hypothetical protein